MNYNLFSTIFVSIMLEAVPFLLLGTFLSSLIEVYVSEDFFRKIMPKNRILALLIASFSGLIFPVCECAIVPVAGRLLKKGVPLYFVITFMLSVPIVNIPVMLSTFYAFSGYFHIFILRIALGVTVPFIIGLVTSFTGSRDKSGIINAENKLSGCGHANCSCGHEHNELPVNSEKAGYVSRLIKAINHTVEEFFETGKYLIAGALITALFQALVPRNILSGVSLNPFFSVLIMMVFAFVLSVCSQTDAFIARSFLGQFTQGSVLAFIVFGPMLDLKNILMFRSVFKKKFIFLFVALICALCFGITFFIGLFLGV